MISMTCPLRRPEISENVSAMSWHTSVIHVPSPCREGESSHSACSADRNVRNPPLLHEPMLLQPEHTITRPRMGIRERRFVVKPDAMPALVVNMKIERHARLAQRSREHQCVLHRHGL